MVACHSLVARQGDQDAGRLAGPSAGIEPTGWHFQFRNAFYPDLDDSAMVILGLNRSPLAGDPAVQAATRRGVNWLLSMQNRDGGWAAYDVDIDNQVLTQLPFADHNAMLDPSCADITARVVELLGTLGYRADHPSVARRLDYLWKTQEPEGCWYGRWGVNYIYGTWQVLQGLKTIDFPWTTRPSSEPLTGWSRSSSRRVPGAKRAEATMTPRLKGTGEPTPSQTAWATLGTHRRRPGLSRRPFATASIICFRPSCPTARGMSPSSRGPDSPGYSIFGITFTASTSP